MAKKEYARNKEGSNISKIIIDEDLCLGCGSCAAVAGSTFKISDENKSVVIDANADDDETLKSAAGSCPAGAIILS